MVWVAVALVLLKNDPLASRWVRGAEREGFQHLQASSGSARKVRTGYRAEWWDGAGYP